MYQFWNRFLSIAFFVLLTVVANAQTTSDSNTPKDNSPFSRIGLGDFSGQNFIHLRTIGGLGNTFHDKYMSNPVNPASYAYLKAATLEGGFFGQYGKLQDKFETHKIWSGNINYLSLSFPMKNPLNTLIDKVQPKYDWGMGISLTPYTTVGYNIFQDSEYAGDDDITNITDVFSGRGGTYKLNWGNGVKYKDFSVGINLGRIFGKIINEKTLTISDTSGVDVFRNNLLDEISLKGFTWNIGLMYEYKFKSMIDGEMKNNGKSITFGATANSKHNIKTNSTHFYKRSSSRYAGVIDTIKYETDVIGSATLPSEFGIGITYMEKNKWRIGIDYTSSLWSQYTNTAKPETLSNGFTIGFGGEYIPNAQSYNNYWKKVKYRFGTFYQKDPRSVNESLTTKAVTFGVGLPVIMKRQKTSFINLGFEIGQFGIPDELNKTYYMLSFGYAFNDNTWFYKRKFN